MKDDEIIVNINGNGKNNESGKHKKKKKKKSKVGRVIKIILLLLLIALVIFGCVFAYKMAKNGGGLQGFLATAIGHDENTLKNLDKLTVMLVGISGSEANYKLADTIMVCSYDPKIQKASILSIPRDTYVGKDSSNPSSSYKINATYRNGENIEGMLEYVNQITGLDIKNYVIVDTVALRQLVDAIGGVTFNVPMDMYYVDLTQAEPLYIDLKEGEQVLNGEQAEGLLRFRKNADGTTYDYDYGGDDFGRMRTQRNFIAAVLKQTLKPENIFKITELIDIAARNVKTNMSFDTVKDYIPYAVNFNADNLNTGMLPGESDNPKGVWIYIYDKKETKALVEELFADPVITETEGEGQATNSVDNTTTSNTDNNSDAIRIELLNGSGVSSNLAKVTKILEDAGFKVTKAGTTSSTAKTNIINRTNKSTTIEDKVKEAIGTGSVSKGAEISNVDFTIVIGKDYKQD